MTMSQMYVSTLYAENYVHRVSKKNCASVIYWITPWNIGRFK